MESTSVEGGHRVAMDAFREVQTQPHRTAQGRVSPVVMLVEPDADLALAWTSRLSQAGYETLAAAWGHEAVSMIHRERPSILLLDIDQPRFSGLELHACLAEFERLRCIPVIYVTAHLGAVRLPPRGVWGAHAVFTKPFEFGRLLHAIRSSLS